jgi:hypothetical protein
MPKRSWIGAFGLLAFCATMCSAAERPFGF